MHYQMWIWSKFENVIAHFLIAMMEELIILYYVLFYMFLFFTEKKGKSPKDWEKKEKARDVHYEKYTILV